jgi:hypothetical protein
MQTLQARTAGLEAGANVERALLRAFRQDTLQGSNVVSMGVKERIGSSRPAATPLSTPVALKLSRFFEVGAYVALAAALLVGVFLGVRILRNSSNAAQVQSQIAPSSVEPLPQKPVNAVQNVVAADLSHIQPARERTARLRSSVEEVATATSQVTNDDAQSLAEVDYTPLMFCDPLSCAADTQVVRVELPAGANGQSSQPQQADLVVGYDGVVRAARIVN